MDHFGLLKADKYEKHVRDTLEVIRKEVPKVVVNLVGVFNVSEIYGVTLDNQHCQLLRGFYHLKLECGCALINGAGASSVRASLNALSSELNTRLIKIRNEYAANPSDTFGVVFQPANIVFSGMPIEVISMVDCFHPSRLGHAWTAKFLWSGLFIPLSGRGANLNYDANYPVYCPNETDRIRLD
jgi:phospholipase B1